MGVILNNVMGTKHADKATSAIEHYCRIPVIGAIPRMEEMELTMRHLGLVPFIERQGSSEFEQRIERVTGMIEEHVSLDALTSIASDIPDVPGDVPLFREEHVTDTRIAVARDEAFNFYYSDLFDILPALGATVVPFSPIRDRLPDAEGYIIGGGYPELFLPGLESNARMREAIREQSGNGVPIYAECGGLMYLTERIRLMAGWQGYSQDRVYEMAGVFHGETLMPARRVVSYVEGESSACSPLGAGNFKGHEFHYSDVCLAPDTRYAYRLTRGTGIEGMNDGAVTEQTLGSYTHLHPVPGIAMFRHFVGRCRTRT